ncbi:MAG: hypothetical protein Unbinned92contig1002_5 [Prokaryotic dsDNA virus sp.]|nr:MAG: hypothetical protein Unbinned92contig1002_5 [Prokaryotic dsDNA virus sp.]|tara:strand:- start:22442 stop:22768 length:327 start_codon:yes stop_codon:yes gene_type:complete
MGDVTKIKQELHNALIDVSTLKLHKRKLERQLSNEKECYIQTVRSYEDSIHKYHSAVIRYLDKDVDQIKDVIIKHFGNKFKSGLEKKLTDIIKTTMTKTILDYEKAIR